MWICPSLEFDDILLIYYQGYDFYNYDAFGVYVIPLSVYSVMYDITTKTEDTLL